MRQFFFFLHFNISGINMHFSINGEYGLYLEIFSFLVVANICCFKFYFIFILLIFTYSIKREFHNFSSLLKPPTSPSILTLSTALLSGNNHKGLPISTHLLASEPTYPACLLPVALDQGFKE